MLDEVVSLLKRLIETESGSGQEQGVAVLLGNYLQGHGFSDVTYDRYGSVLARARGKRAGKRVLFDGHIDTVPCKNASDWTSPPFCPTVRDGRLYGRGATDMKGADAAFAVAAARFLAETGGDFAGELCFAGVVQEECFEGVCARSVGEAVKPDLVIIGEASEGNLKCSQRGRAELVLETFGVPCHSANPEQGVNAAVAMCRLIERIAALPPTVDARMQGDGILVLTDILSEPYPGASVVPHHCRATFDRRLLPDETRESVLAPIRKIIQEEQAKDATLRAHVGFTCGEAVCYTGETVAAERFFPAWVQPPDDDVRRVQLAMEAVGLSPKITGYRFCTNGSYYGGEAGVRCIGYGPSQEALAHTIDESVSLAELSDAAKGYLAMLHTLLDGGA